MPFLLASGLGMVLAQKFSWAYPFFIVFGIWSSFYWLTHESLAQKRKWLGTRAVKKDVKLYAHELHKYWGAEWGGCALIFGITAAMCWGTFLANQQQEREEVLEKLVIEYSIPPGYENDPMKSVISVINGSTHDISPRHRIACVLEGAISSTYGIIVTGMASFEKPNGAWGIAAMPYQGEEILANEPIEESVVLHAGGDAQSASCIKVWGIKDTDCVDMTIHFQYYLTSQPLTRQDKKLRIFTYRTGDTGFQWYKQSQDRKGTYCDEYLMQHRDRRR